MRGLGARGRAGGSKFRQLRLYVAPDEGREYRQQQRVVVEGGGFCGNRCVFLGVSETSSTRVQSQLGADFGGPPAAKFLARGRGQGHVGMCRQPWEPAQVKSQLVGNNLGASKVK